VLTFPARYLDLDHFLTDEEHQTLLAFVQAHDVDLIPSEVLNAGGESRPSPTYRSSRVLFDVEEIWPFFAERLTALLPHVRKELGVLWFPLRSIERQLTSSGDGDFFRTHIDSGTESVAGRILTYVYYFNTEPRGYTGGALRLYDGIIRDNGFLDRGSTYVDLEPRNNSIVFFPSCLHHEVRPVQATGEGIAGRRLTINGWFLQESAG
jgi:Rps23 Pro-64 3,4-dihydroxylase Tpa1-like proline 4-hydroxylase